MRNTPILSLCLGVSMLFAAHTVYADPGKGSEQKSARAMQIQIDKTSGRKIGASDSDAELNQAASTTVNGLEDATSALLANKSLPPVLHADGTLSAQVGTEQMKYVVMTVGKDGQRSFSHTSAESIESGVTPSSNTVEEK